MKIIPQTQEFLALLKKFKAILMYQYNFSKNELKLIDDSKLTFKISYKTKRLKYVYYNDQLFATFRYQDGNLIFTTQGARIIKEIVPPPKLRIVIQSDITKFISKGRNLFVKHVLNFDQELLPGSEVIIVDSDDNFVAIGKLIMSKKDIENFKSGIAVKVR